MPIDIVAETVIDRPRDAVARFAMDPANETRWIGGIRSSRQLTDGPIGAGAEVERVAAFLGRRIEYVLRVVEHEPTRLIVMASSRGPFPMRVTYAFADADGGGTRVHNRVQGETAGFYRLAAPLMAGQVRRSLARDLATLKRLMEAGPAPV